MSEKKYLIYIDILGFEKLAKEIASQKGMETRYVREHFINVIQRQVVKLERNGRIIGKHHGTDDWLLVVDRPNKVFGNILEISENHTGYSGYERVPLELAVGLAEFDKWAIFEGESIVTQDASIDFLKTHIVEHYREWYKDKHDGNSVESTFAILTESAQRELESLSRGLTDSIEYEGGRFFVVDIERMKEKSRVFEFLDKIGYSNSKLYDSIDSLYIPPVEYPDIERTLKENRIVFITGTQEYGKTYTAAKLMWEYYCRGYEPMWVKGNEEYERVRSRERLEEIRIELKPKHIIYFEDPFGRTRYEKRESLEREIGIILDFVDQVDDAYVVITSREEVFKEFEKEKISAREIKEFEQKLNIRKPSYDYERRKAILVQWANKENCQWLSNQTLKELILDSLRDEMLLPTPLSIRDFTISSVNMQNESELTEKMMEKSEETETAFAREIAGMSEDKFIFLAFPFVGLIPVKIAKYVYQKLIREFGLKKAWEFERVMDWFEDDKVQTMTRWYIHGGESVIVFSHPTYYQAFERLLGTQETYVKEAKKELFAELLVKLEEVKEVAREIAQTIYWNFHALPIETRNQLLAKLANEDEAIYSVTRTVTENYDELPEHFRVLPFRLLEKDECVSHVAYAVEDGFDKIPEDVRNELVTKLAEKNEAIESVVWTIAGNFDKLPRDVANLLFWLIENKTWIVHCVTSALAENINKYEDSVRSEIIRGIARSDSDEWDIPELMINYADKLPEDVRRLLIEKQNKHK